MERVCYIFDTRMARPTGFEPVTYGLEVRCSIQLSYERISDFSDPGWERAVVSLISDWVQVLRGW